MSCTMTMTGLIEKNNCEPTIGNDNHDFNKSERQD